MKFKVSKASNYNYRDEVEINTLEELLSWCKNTGNKVIINEKQDSLEIYDSSKE